MASAGSEQAKKPYCVISADCHVLEPPDLWERRVAPKFRHRLPRMELDDRGRKTLIVEGQRPTRIRDFSLEGDDLERAKAAAGRRANATPIWTGTVLTPRWCIPTGAC